jgi:hypothetical protein
MNTTQLDRLRRRAEVKALSVHTRLIDRPTPWRDWQPIARQLCAIGFRDIDNPDQAGSWHEEQRSQTATVTWQQLCRPHATQSLAWRTAQRHAGDTRGDGQPACPPTADRPRMTTRNRCRPTTHRAPPKRWPAWHIRRHRQPSNLLRPNTYGGGGVGEGWLQTGQRPAWKFMRAQVSGYPLRPNGFGLLADHVAPQQFAAFTGLESLAGPFRTLLHPA